MAPAVKCEAQLVWRRLCEPFKSFIQKHSMSPYSMPGLCLPNVSQHRPTFSWSCTPRRKTDHLTHLNRCNPAGPYRTSPVQALPNTCFSSSPKNLDNNMWITFPELFTDAQFSPVQLFATPWTAACQASLSTNSQSLLKLFKWIKNHQFFGAQLSLWPNFHIHTWLLEKP